MKTKTITLISLSFFLVLSYLSCITKVNNGETVNVNPAFEMNPPIARSIEFKQLDKSVNNKNFLLTAIFDSGLIKNRFLKILVDSDSLLLRDDGKEGDEKAGDNIFSVLIQDDPAIVKEEITNIKNKFALGLKNNIPVVRFINRSPIPIEVEQFLRVDTSLKISSTIPSGLLNSIPPDPLLTFSSLMINNLGVVEDPSRTFNPCTSVGKPAGAWTFNTLISNMANTSSTRVTAEAFTRSLLRGWIKDVTVNTDKIVARPRIFDVVIKPWIIKSNPLQNPIGINITNWETFHLDLKLAPFKLLAIVNRLDLRGNSGYGFSNAGEGRFVFGVVDNVNCNPEPFTVIFEYGIPKSNCNDLHAFAQQWVNLKTMTPGSVSYNTALEAITNQFTAAGAAPGKPNGSALNQIRSNEFALASPWELRERVIDSETHLLVDTTVKKEPIETFNRLGFPSVVVPNNITLLGKFINDNDQGAAVVNNSYVVPLTLAFPTTHFLGGKAHTRAPDPAYFWDANSGQITNDTARHIFSINTCSGCHGGEGNTSVGNLINDPMGKVHMPFTQVGPQPFGAKATLSAFLTGDPTQSDKMFNVNDPAHRTPVWKFNDLLRRAIDLESLVTTDCRSKVFRTISILSFNPVRMTH